MEKFEKIRAIRLSKNLTQAHLADRLGIDTGNYSRLERGETKITVERLEKIAEILEVDASELFAENELENISKSMQETMTEILVEIRAINKKMDNLKSRTLNGE